MGSSCRGNQSISDRRYRGLFGVSDLVTSDLWQMLPSVDSANPKYLLWGLLFLKYYNTEHLHAVIAGCDEKRSGNGRNSTYRICFKFKRYEIHIIKILESYSN